MNLSAESNHDTLYSRISRRTVHIYFDLLNVLGGLVKLEPAQADLHRNELRLYRTIVPQMVLWLPDDETAQWRLDSRPSWSV